MAQKKAISIPEFLQKTIPAEPADWQHHKRYRKL